LQASSKARGEIFNIGGTEEVTILQLAERVIQALGSNSEIEFVPYSEAYAPGFDDMRRRKPVVEKLKRVTGFVPQTSLDQIIQRTAQSLKTAT